MLVSPPSELETRPLTDFLFADGVFNAPRFKRHLTEFADKNSPHLWQSCLCRANRGHVHRHKIGKLILHAMELHKGGKPGTPREYRYKRAGRIVHIGKQIGHDPDAPEIAKSEDHLT